MMEGVRRGPPNAVRHHGEEKEEEVFWDVALCIMIKADRRFIGDYFLHHQGDYYGSSGQREGV
jgi:hypothetical protein